VNRRRLRRTLAALALTAAALTLPAVIDDVLSPQDDTAWGAPATAEDTAWGTPPVQVPDVTPPVDGIIGVIPLDTAWG
jgi:hypothetical protein